MNYGTVSSAFHTALTITSSYMFCPDRQLVFYASSLLLFSSEVEDTVGFEEVRHGSRPVGASVPAAKLNLGNRFGSLS